MKIHSPSTTLPSPWTPPRREEGWERAVDSVAEVGRWVELDETAAVLFRKLPKGAMTTLGVMDGLVTAYDGLELARTSRGDKGLLTGGLVRVGLGLGGMAPGLAGAIFEGACGLFCAGEGQVRGDDVTRMTGLTQVGVSAGIAAMALGVRGPLGPALVLGSGAARVGFLLHDMHQRRQNQD